MLLKSCKIRILRHEDGGSETLVHTNLHDVTQRNVRKHYTGPRANVNVYSGFNHIRKIVLMALKK